MEKISRETMGGIKFFLSLILVISCICERNGQEIATEEAATAMSQEMTSILSQEDIPIREAPFPFQFPRDRIPSGVSKRIIGGNVATPNAYPYQAALHVLLQGNLYLCGGTLITTEWVLTAAHCMDGASSVLVILGAHDISQVETTRVTYNSTKFIIHEGWNSTSLRNDVALIRLPQNVTLNSNITIVQIAQGTDTYSGILGRCLGWGRTVIGFISSVLRYVDVEILSNEDCRTYEDYSPYILNHHLCTSGEGFLGSCYGDSGGPLIVNGVQVGIVSFGVPNCTAGLPSVFTRLSEFNSWIGKSIENYNDTSANNGGGGSMIGSLMRVYIGVVINIMLLNCL